MLKKTVDGIKNRIVALAADGFLWIFFGSFATQLFGFISSVVVIRNLPKAEYGIYVDANNIYSYMAIFIGMGMVSAILQFCSEAIENEKKLAIYRFSFKTGSLFNVLLFAVIYLIGLIYKPDSAGYYLRMMCGYPLVVYTTNYLQMILRVKRKNKEFALVYTVYAITICAGNIVFTHLWGITGLVMSFYFSEVSMGAAAFYFLKKNGFFKELTLPVDALSHDRKKEITTFCVLSMATNFVTTALVLLDITCLNYVLGDSQVLADYKVASAIPSAMMFIPQSMVVYFYPLMVENYSKEPQKFAGQIFGYEKVFFGVSLFFAGLMLVFAPLIIYIVYGQKYMSCVQIFRMLSLNFFVNSAVRQLFANAITVIKKVKINLLFAAVSGVLNVVLDIALIKQMGSMGAAIATVVVTLFIALLEIGYIYSYSKRIKTEKLL